MFVATPDHLLQAVRFGTAGPAFVASGGWIGSWELWQDPFASMHERWRCVGFDHRGTGSSATTGGRALGTSPDELVDDLVHVLDHFEIDRCVLAGTSFGATSCLRAAQRLAHRVQALVLVGAVTDLSPSGPAHLLDGAAADWPTAVGRFVDAAIVEPDSDHVKAWARQILARAQPEVALAVLEGHAAPGALPALDEMHVPTLLLHGQLDQVVPIAEAQRAADAIPGAELVEVGGAGHLPTLTKPHLVVDLIDTWARRRLDLAL